MDGEADFIKRESLLAFPTEFPIKIMGRREGNFAQGAMVLFLRHSRDFRPQSMEVPPSRQAKYLGITETTQTQSRA